MKYKSHDILTVVEPAIFKAIERVEQRHVQDAHHLTDRVDGEQTYYHSLKQRGQKTLLMGEAILNATKLQVNRWRRLFKVSVKSF